MFLHEGLGSIAMWKDFPGQLASALDLNAFVYSRQGYGWSDPATLPRKMDYLEHEATHVLPGVLDHMGIEKAILVGHSDGASIALISAATEAKRRSLALLLMTGHVFYEDELMRTGLKEAKRLYETTGFRERLAKYHSDVEHVFRGWNDIWLHPDFTRWNIEAFLPNIDCPVLHIQGENDQYATEAQPLAIQQQCSGPVETVMLPDCGHSPHLEQTQLTIHTMQNFLQTQRIFL